MACDVSPVAMFRYASISCFQVVTEQVSELVSYRQHEGPGENQFSIVLQFI